MTATRLRQPASPPLKEAMLACRDALVTVAIVSGLINLLMLTGPLFMLQIYDRVLPSRSMPTLVGLSLLALLLFAFQGVLDGLRARILTRIGISLDDQLGARVFDGLIGSTLSKASQTPDRMQPIRDLDALRAFVSSSGLVALFDLPWIPLYIGICFVFHFWIGATVLGGAIVLLAVTCVNDFLTRRASRAILEGAAFRRMTAETVRRNATLVHALGMRGRMAELWRERSDAFLYQQQTASDRAGDLGSLARFLRMVLQSGVLAVGAYLVVHQQATAGVMIASTILAMRAMAPLELATANWNGFVGARESWARLSDLLSNLPVIRRGVSLPPPKRSIRLTAVSLMPPGTNTVVLHDISFQLEAGSALGIVGPSGSGKSSLARALVGAWQPVRGVIRLDEATLDQWEPDVLGRSIGYLPQDVELFEGTVAENIARFDADADSSRVTKAAELAGVHDLILRLPNGYDTDVGEAGCNLSGGQRQRIGLARALYGDPFLLVLDEPNSNLDTEGERALANAVVAVRKRGGIAIVITHRQALLAAFDWLMVVSEGRMQQFGRRQDLVRPPPAAKPEAARQRAIKKPSEARRRQYAQPAE